MMKKRFDLHIIFLNIGFLTMLKLVPLNILKMLSIVTVLSLSKIAMALETPTNLQVKINSPSQITWSWDAVSGATQYEVTMDGVYYGLTPNLTLSKSDLWPGEHSLSVRAMDDNGQFSTGSAQIKTDSSTFENQLNTVALADQRTESAGPVDPASYEYPEVFEKPDYELAFSDEFNGSSLDGSKWNTQLRWDGEFNGERYEYRVINGENQFYVNIYSDDQEHLTSVAPAYNPFQFDGSRLAIRAKRNPLKTNNNNATYGPLNTIVEQQEFLSGAITTYDKFTQKYGIFEARIKIPSHVGTFPAFWLHHQRRHYEDTRKTEIDIMENLGHAPWYVYNSFHHFDNVSETYGGDPISVKPQPEGQIFNGTDFSQEFHTYGVKWEPGYIAWLIDGEVVSEVFDSNVDHEELYVILNLAMGGLWTNFPANAGGLGREFDSFFPNFDDLNTFEDPALEIDYVRVYRRK